LPHSDDQLVDQLRGEGVAHPVAGLIFLQKGASQEVTPIDSMSEPELAAVVQAVDLEGLL